MLKKVVPISRRLKLWKLKTVMVPTLLGWAALAGLFIGFAISTFKILPHALQMRHPVASKISAKILVTEGWMNREMMKDVIQEFNAGNFELLLVTGGPVDHDPAEHASGAITFAEQGAWALRSLGFPQKNLIAVPTLESSARNRSLSFAKSLINWLEKNQPETRAFTVITESFHSRRSYWTYQRAVKNRYEVGILGIHDPYLILPWWSTSKGFKHVIMEAIAVLYSIPNLIFSD